MKLLKLLFSKALVVALVFVLQILLLAGVVLYYTEQFVVLQVISLLIGLLTFCHLLHRKQSPEFKLAWLFVLLTLPLFGTILYLLFASPRANPGQVKRMRLSREASMAQIIPHEEEAIPPEADPGAYAGTEKYITVQTGMPALSDSRATYFPMGERFYEDLLAELARAEHFIFMEYFIISYGKMWDGIHEILCRKAKAGVEVRVMYDDIGTVGKLRDSYDRQLRREGIQCCKFNPFRPVVSGVYNNRDHRKITVIDGRIGYTGGVNIGDEYINETHPYGTWKDTAIKIEGQAVKNLTAMFLQMYDAAAKQHGDYAMYFPVQETHFEDAGCIQPFGDMPRPLDNEQIGENTFLNMIGTAKTRLWIMTPYLIPDYSLVTALRNAAGRGVDVRLVVPHIPDKRIIFRMTRSNYRYLMESGVRIYEYTPGFIHAKVLLADSDAAFVGTINFDYRSLVHHFECGAVLYRTPCLDKIAEDFTETFAVSQERTKENFKEGRLLTLGGAILNLFSPML